MNPSFLLTALIVVIGFIVWLVRLEGKVSNNSTKIELQQKAQEKLATEVEHHRFNTEIHFNHRLSQEVDQRNKDRFGHIEKRLDEVMKKLDDIAEKQ